MKNTDVKRTMYRLFALGGLAGALVLLFGACGANDASEGRQPLTISRGMGKADSDYSCLGRCGSNSGKCKCDDACSMVGDCCPDKASICDGTSTCAGQKCVAGSHCEMKGVNGAVIPVCIEDAKTTPKTTPKTCADQSCNAGYHCEMKGINGGSVPVCIKDGANTQCPLTGVVCTLDCPATHSLASGAPCSYGVWNDSACSCDVPTCAAAGGECAPVGPQGVACKAGSAANADAGSCGMGAGCCMPKATTQTCADQKCDADSHCEMKGVNGAVIPVCIKDAKPTLKTTPKTCADQSCNTGYHCEMKGINGGSVPVCIKDGANTQCPLTGVVCTLDCPATHSLASGAPCSYGVWNDSACSCDVPTCAAAGGECAPVGPQGVACKAGSAANADAGSCGMGAGCCMPKATTQTCASQKCDAGSHCEMKGVNGAVIPVCIKDAKPTPKTCADQSCNTGYHCEMKGINGGSVPVCIKDGMSYCQGFCGKSVPTATNCYCDSKCEHFGDCCPSIKQECPKL